MHPRAKEVHGGEFDWFAVDASGNLALFSTAGEGVVPDSVLRSLEDYESMSRSFEAPRWGTGEIWKDYAELGLFVFDWTLPSGSYRKLISPTAPASSVLKAKLLGLAGLPRFGFSFRDVELLEGAEIGASA